MSLDRISEEKLFQNNTKEELSVWCRNLRYFHYMRARGGHNCEGDSFCVYVNYSDRNDLLNKMGGLGISLNKMDEGSVSYDPFKSYTIDDLDNLKIPIPGAEDLEQPQYVDVFGFSVHVWIMNGRFEISVSGTKDGQTYRVTDDDYRVCLLLEKKIDGLVWKNALDDDIKAYVHCVTRERYPELF